MTSTTVTAGANWGTNYVNVSWFGSRPVLTTPRPGPLAQLRSAPLRRRHRPRQVLPVRHERSRYDATQSLFQEDRSLLTYKGSCYTVFLEIRQLRLPPAPRHDYRLVVNLKDIGTLLDVNGSIDALFGGGSRSASRRCSSGRREAPARFGMILRQ